MIWSGCKKCGNSNLICIEDEALAERGENHGEILETKLHHYRYDIDDPKDYGAWIHTKEQLKLEGLEVFDTIAMDLRKKRNWYANIKKLEGQTIYLETKYLFNNQWNTVRGLRLMDWAETIYPNKDINEGYWLEQTNEMRAIRKKYNKCKYCGALVEAGSGPCKNHPECIQHGVKSLTK